MTHKELAIDVVSLAVARLKINLILAQRACVGVDPTVTVGDADYTPVELLAMAEANLAAMKGCLVWLRTIDETPTIAGGIEP